MTRGIATLAVAGAVLGMLLSPVQAQGADEVLPSVSEGATDLPNDNSTPGRVAVGGSATGAIGTPKDQDRFAVDLQAGRTYRFDLTGRPGGGGTLRDTYFRAIYNSEGRYQSGSYNDDFDGGRDSRVTFTAPGSGTYYARVSGDRNETGTYTLSVTDVTPEQGAGPPDKPGGLEATATHGRVVLTWDDPGDDSITGYVILRRNRDTDVKGHFDERVADTGSAATTYTDDTVAAETRYTYRIKAINAYGTSERSRWYHIDTPAAPQAVFVEGDDPDEQGGEDDPVGAPGQDAPGGAGGTDEGVELRQVPPRPTGFAASNGNGQVTLTWDAPADMANIWHHEYRFKTTGDYNDWKKIDDSEVGKSHEDWVVVTGLTNDVAYTFQLRIVNRDGNGNEVTASQATPTDGFCGRTEQVRVEIMRQISGVSDCAVVTSAQLAGVMSLDFASVVIKSLQLGDFSGLTALTDLSLIGNELSSFPVGAFSGLTALETLNLRDNELSSLPVGAFFGLTALTDLTLSDNELSSLPVGAFSGLTALKTLNLDRNELSSLPAGVFSGLTALTDLRLVSNELRSLPAGVFSGLTALTDLSLFRNELTSLPAGVFSDLTALTFLNLESNEFTSLPAGVFSRLTALTSLYLRYNKLSSLPAGVFSRLTALTDLRLGPNEFTSLPAGVFSDLTALTNLTLIGAKLSSLPAGVFSGLTALTSLYLRENTVDPLPLTVTLERNPDAVEIRAVVLTAAPFAVPLVVSVANGSLAGGAATITVPTGARESAWVGVTRTDGTAGAVTADIDLTPQPILPDKHDGYEFVKSASDLPLTVLSVPGAPTAPSVSAASSSSLTVIWSAPDDGGSAITDYDVQYRAGTGSVPRQLDRNWACTSESLEM